MTARSQPWWYSGDDTDRPDVVLDADSAPDRTDVVLDAETETDTSAPPADPEAVATGSRPGEDDASSTGIEWTALLAGAQRMVDWATEKVMAPHAEHADPAEHPQCVVCRTMVLIGEGRTLVTDGERPGAPEEADAEDADAEDADDSDADDISVTVTADREIMWIPIRGQVPAP